MSFSNLTPITQIEKIRGLKVKTHLARVVIHPDYTGLGLGIRLSNFCSSIMIERGYEVYIKTTNAAMIGQLNRDPNWRLKTKGIRLNAGFNGSRKIRGGDQFKNRARAVRTKVNVWSFRYIGAAQ